MPKYRYTEHGKGYQVGQTLRQWRPGFDIVISWIPKGSRILDIGCGDGVLGERLIKQKSCLVYGFDLDPIGVKESTRRGIKAKVWDANEPLPYKDSSFDVIVCHGILQMIKKPNQLISESLRVSKTIIVEFSNFGFWFYRLEHLFGRFPRFLLYGHNWWETNQVSFFSYSDFLQLPALKKAQIKKLVCIDWKNRHKSLLGKFWPNLFGRSCILYLEKI